MDKYSDIQVMRVSVDLITPNKDQPRKHFDKVKLAELESSIEEYGILQPMVVRKVKRGYEIIAGERRWRASKNIGLEKVPVIVRDIDDFEVSKLALVENIQREDLNRLEEAKGYEELIKQYGISIAEVGRLMGKSRPYISNALRLLELSPVVKDSLVRGLLSQGHARALLGLKDFSDQVKMLDKIVKKELTVREVENLIRDMSGVSTGKKEKKDKKSSQGNANSDIRHVEERLEDLLSAKVRIDHSEKSGSIKIDYSGVSGLNSILEKIGYEFE